jgi:hypothetical protein
MIEKLKFRIQELEKMAETSAVSHHSIIGRITEAKEWLKNLEEEASKVVDVVQEQIKECVGEVI